MTHKPITDIHDLKYFFGQTSQVIAAEYTRICQSSREDPGTAGDAGENVWSKIISDWLPESYFVTTKGRLISADGRKSPQLDVVVLKPGYPRMLREKKIYLADGVAAVFECKNTLDRRGLVDAIEKCRVTKQLFAKRTGSPLRELVSPIVCGILAHSHSWNSENDVVVNKIAEICKIAEAEIEEPRFLLDVLCVANLGAWERAYMLSSPAKPTSDLDEHAASPPESDIAITTLFMCAHSLINEMIKEFHPAGALISSITKRFAVFDSQFDVFSDYYRRVGLTGSLSGMGRDWHSSIFSDGVFDKIRQNTAIDLSDAHEWRPFFFF